MKLKYFVSVMIILSLLMVGCAGKSNIDGTYYCQENPTWWIEFGGNTWRDGDTSGEFGEGSGEWEWVGEEIACYRAGVGLAHAFKVLDDGNLRSEYGYHWIKE